MDASGIFGLIFAGIVIGGLGRLILPGRQPIGCLITILIGVVGAAVGYYIGDEIDVGSWITFAIQVLLAAVLVALFVAIAGMNRRRPP